MNDFERLFVKSDKELLQKKVTKIYGVDQRVDVGMVRGRRIIIAHSKFKKTDCGGCEYSCKTPTEECNKI
jgi:hypothetical protein